MMMGENRKMSFLMKLFPLVPTLAQGVRDIRIHHAESLSEDRYGKNASLAVFDHCNLSTFGTHLFPSKDPNSSSSIALKRRCLVQMIGMNSQGEIPM